MFRLFPIIVVVPMAACTAADVATRPSPIKVDASRLVGQLTLWPEDSRRTIAEAVARAAARDTAPPFATFDADGTIWSSDATESFLAYLDAQGILKPDHIEAHLRIVPFLPGEGVYSYYLRLCEKDKAIGYPWCAQAFAGFTLADLRHHYTTMMKKAGSKVRVWTAPAGETPVSREEFIAVPKLFAQQAQLVHALENNGIRVYIVTASPEEIVRFLACAPTCDPLFTLDLPPERIIGINVLLRDDRTGDVTSSHCA